MRTDTLVYVLHTAPGADQDLLHSHEEAVAQAVTCAKRESVRAWLTNEGYDCVLLEDFRVGSPKNERGFHMAKTKTANKTVTATDSSRKSPAKSATFSNSDIAHRAYDLYLARARTPGHDVEDWLQAEHDLCRSAAE